MPRPLTIVAILAAYNEDDIIAEAVRALIAEGVLVYVLDHHSTDETRARLEPFRGRGVIGIETFPSDTADDELREAYAWEQILRRKEELAQELDADWFVHHDADEFRESPWSGQTLRQGIERVDAADYNAIDFQVLNFLPTSADRADGDDIRERLVFYEPGRIYDHQQVKCWKKTNQPAVLTTSGGHSVEFAGRRVFPIRFLLRHYPIRSQAHGERKVFRERLPRLVPRERARGWHVQYDHFLAGTPFVRDPASLLRYDPEAVRLDLFLRHRNVERLERIAAESQDVSDQLAALRRHLQAQDAELDWLRPERERLLKDLEALQHHLQAQDAELDRLRPEREHLLSDLEALRRPLQANDTELDGLRRQLAAKEADIATLLASRSWKLTAPLRAAERLLRGSPESS
jgi:glycosyltransferase involved in cell wall biosynthesis